MIHAQAVYWELGHGYVDASDLGLKPGEWPATLEVLYPEGKKISFCKGEYVVNSEGFLSAVLYKAGNGETLTVYND